MICIDTALLIWGIRAVATEGQEGMIPLTQKYLRHLDNRRKKVLVPAPVLAEFLVGSGDTEARRAELEEVIARNFRVAPLDLPAAHKAAEIQERSLMRQLRQEGGDRDELKIDAMVVAIGILRGAEIVVSNDAHIHRLACGLIPVIEIPDVPEQPDLFV